MLALPRTVLLLAAAVASSVNAVPLMWFWGNAAVSTPVTYDTWVWKDLANNVCANGSPTGYAVNQHKGSSELLIYIDGGGACWDANTCFTNPTASNLNGYNNASFQASSRAALESQILLTSRDSSRANPWASSNFVFIPYCTGDIHGGNAVVTYPGAPSAINHHGYVNVQNILKAVANDLPNINTVWITGTSAGCYGATLHYSNAKKTFYRARTNLIADSCATTPGFLGTKPSWNLQQPSSSDCPGCQKNEFNTFLPALSKANSLSRFAAMFYQQDTTLPGFMGDSVSDFATIISAYFANITSTSTSKAKDFTDPQSGHGVLYELAPVSTTGARLADWLAQMKSGSSSWKSV